MRDVMAGAGTRDRELGELRRVIGVVRHRPLRTRLDRLVDDLEREAGWDRVEEIRATRELATAIAERDEARADLDDAMRRHADLEADLGTVRRERDAALERLRELRELARSGLGDELVEVCVRIEAEHPTRPPLLALRQAARLVRAVRAA